MKSISQALLQQGKEPLHEEAAADELPLPDNI